MHNENPEESPAAVAEEETLLTFDAEGNADFADEEGGPNVIY